MASSRELQQTNPEIVNGLQTSNEIYNFYSQNESLLQSERRNVLVRVIVPETERVRDDFIQDLEVFYKCAVLGKRIQRNLKMKSGYTSSERNDMLFYLLYGTVADILQKGNIMPTDIKEMDLNNVTEERIGRI